MTYTRACLRNTIPSSEQDAAGPQENPAQRNIRLLKEIEDEQQVFQRNTMKLAMEMAKSEADKAMTKALTVEANVL